ncbi:MAG: 3-deoxy-manno-octulosonate cytidylyltransferase [Alphaproteobacteria bacterium]
MGATRLPDKPLADINGRPMIAHVVDRAIEADLGPVCVATDDKTIAQAAQEAGAVAVLTRRDHVSGSDRIFEALNLVDPDGAHDIVVNLQGDLPTLEKKSLQSALEPLADKSVDIATLAAEITDPAEKTDPSIVKIAAVPVSGNATAAPLDRIGRRFRALYFSRATIPANEGPLYHHIGIYVYRRAALARFVDLPPGHLEQRERLEQLRAIEAGMRIDGMLVDTVPLGVDTPADLDRARALLAKAPFSPAASE